METGARLPGQGGISDPALQAQPILKSKTKGLWVLRRARVMVSNGSASYRAQPRQTRPIQSAISAAAQAARLIPGSQQGATGSGLPETKSRRRSAGGRPRRFRPLAKPISGSKNFRGVLGLTAIHRKQRETLKFRELSRGLPVKYILTQGLPAGRFPRVNDLRHRLHVRLP